MQTICVLSFPHRDLSALYSSYNSDSRIIIYEMIDRPFSFIQPTFAYFNHFPRIILYENKISSNFLIGSRIRVDLFPYPCFSGKQNCLARNGKRIRPRNWKANMDFSLCWHNHYWSSEGSQIPQFSNSRCWNYLGFPLCHQSYNFHRINHRWMRIPE